MNIIQDFLINFTWDTIVKTGLRISMLLVLAWIAMNLIQKFLQRLEKHLIKKSEDEGEPPSESEKRVETIVRLIKQACLIALWLTFGLVIIREFGIDIGPIIASAGVAGLAIGFGAQNLVRDIISGFFIILENQIRVGDVAILNGTGGLVEKINFRTTVLRDLGGVVHIFPNGTITTLSNLTNGWSAYVFEIGVAYKENTDHVIDVMKAVGKTMREDEKFGKSMLEDLDVFGVDKFDDSSIVIKGRIKTKPIKQWEVGREFLRRVKYAFDENNIEIPFPHQSIYFGEKSKPFDLQLLEKLQNQEKPNN
ncbi:MAG: mechanosensitive ion channel family protein [Deltaproteobacteria bacterium]|uniref:mechanosensitive ion channel family protein n=1 Tax=Desulfobacula sp. TaxID=2593537 RepID=UPI00199CDB53|nr:mechanosensitive ion channel family protein [Candidatus Desulfobacula maris]MBL6993235.1 mechanosensitive ion channel family protein [Desulfobacula sp.]